MSFLIPGKNPLSYEGVISSAPPEVVIKSRAPTTRDNRHNVGTWWIDKLTLVIYTLIDVHNKIANWKSLTSSDIGNGLDGQVLIGGGSSAVWDYITSTGGTVVVTSGDHTINLDLAGTVPLLFTEDVGSAQAISNVLNVVGGSNINTAGATNVVTVNLDNSISVSGDFTVGTSATSGTGVTVTTGGIDATGTIQLQDLNAGVLQSNGSGVISSSYGTDGQILIGATGGAPAWANITSTGASITITNGSNTIDLVAVGSLPASSSSFAAYLSSTVTDVTGDATDYTIIYDTEVLDKGSDYDHTTGVFTAPSDGYYHFGAWAAFLGDTSGATIGEIFINTSSETIRGDNWPTINRVANFYGYNSLIHYYVSASVELSASDTVSFSIKGTGGSKVSDVYQDVSYCFGFLLAS